jgi:hypothetical protein
MQQTYIVTIQYMKSTDSNAMQCCNKALREFADGLIAICCNVEHFDYMKCMLFSYQRCWRMRTAITD